MVRDPVAERAGALGHRGVELVKGDYPDPASIRRAMIGVQGVFSVQPASTTAAISDEDEVRYGIAVAGIAVETAVEHLVYSSVAAVGDTPTGMGHLHSKARTEAHIRTLPLTWTIVRPVAFMDMLTMPGIGLDEDRFTFFARPDQEMQLLAVEDIGKFVAPIFADPGRFGGRTLELAGDTVTGAQIGAAFSKAAGWPIDYPRFPDELLVANPFFVG